MSELTHLDRTGAANMVDVSDKPATSRLARAEGRVVMLAETVALIRAGDAKKGDVLGTARIAGIMAAKRTSDLIPLCHPLALSKVTLDIEPDKKLPGCRVRAQRCDLDHRIPYDHDDPADRIGSLRAGRGDDSPAVLIVPNFSVGAVLAARFAEQAATWFESIEIVEAHHAGKADSPSGTAVATAERIAAARSELGPVAAPHTDQRARGQQVGSVPIHSLRLDGVQAQQSVLLGGPGELLTLKHETTSPVAYAAGIRLALRALPGLSGVVVGLEPLLAG